ncbi:MAG: hydantoinase/oxoprolinase family protein, partial [Hyphomicrobiales bacterium]|nr:hydantoinase/oxoprolinase family protein [Hyphomicrobiales bacterium]
YIGPRVRRNLGEIGDHLEAAGVDGDFLIVQSTGGLFGVEEAQSACIRMLESGPAAGVIGTKALCDRIGLKNAIAFDMGGTTAKAGVIHGGDVLMTGSALIGGYATGLPVQIPMIDIQEVGTGGGSIARADVGALHVGPESAGAQPGPVCHGLGGVEPTITDANLILGRLGADRFLGGEIKLDAEGARRALEARVATPLGLDLTAAADGILRIATTKMSHMVRWVTTERGLDAADFTLVAYGGAGPLHAAMVARELRIAKVVVPRAPGHFSAYGMLVAELRRDFVKTWFTPLAEASFAAMENIYAEMERRGREAVRRSDVAVAGIAIERAADMRYVGQEHAVTVELPLELFQTEDREGIKMRFDAVHATRYGYSASGEKAEIVSLRSAITGLLRKPTFEPIAAGQPAPPPGAFRGSRPVYFAEAGRPVDTPSYDRASLLAENRIAGPALIEEYASTTVVHPGDVATVDAFGDLVIEILRS